VRVVPVPVSSIRITVEVMGVVVRLELAVVLDDPIGPFRHVGSEDRRREFAMVVGRQLVPDIVQQRRHDQFLVRAVAMRPGRGLERVLEPVDLKRQRLVLERPQLCQQAIDQAFGMLPLKLLEQEVVVASAVLHPGEAYAFH